MTLDSGTMILIAVVMGIYIYRYDCDQLHGKKVWQKL